MPSQEQTIHAYQINPGDEFWGNDSEDRLYWTAIGEVEWDGDSVRVPVQYVDGGTGARMWFSHQEITIRRPL